MKSIQSNRENNITACVEVASDPEYFKKSRIFNPKSQVLVVYNDYDYTIDDLLRELRKFDWSSIQDTLHISIQNCMEIDSLYCTSSNVLLNDGRLVQFFVLKLMVIYDGSKGHGIFSRFINEIMKHNYPFMVEAIMNPSLFDHLYLKRGFRNDLLNTKSSLYKCEFIMTSKIDIQKIIDQIVEHFKLLVNTYEPEGDWTLDQMKVFLDNKYERTKNFQGYTFWNGKGLRVEKDGLLFWHSKYSNIYRIGLDSKTKIIIHDIKDDFNPMWSSDPFKGRDEFLCYCNDDSPTILPLSDEHHNLLTLLKKRLFELDGSKNYRYRIKLDWN